MQNHSPDQNPDQGRGLSGLSCLFRNPDSRQAILWGLFIVVAVAIVYGTGLGNALIFDDERLRDGTVFSAYASLQLKERMLSYGSFVWIQALFGENWPLQRAVNILIHLGVVAILYRFLRLMLDQVSWPESAEATKDPAWLPRSKEAAALFGTAVFALNPVAVYAVAYLIQRSILLATLFSVIALYAAARAGAGHGRAMLAWLAAALLAYILAVFAKEHAVMLPAAALAVFLVVRKPARKQATLALALSTLFLAVGAYALFSRYGSLFGQVFDDMSRDYLSQLVAIQPGVKESAWPLSMLNQSWLYFKYGFLWLLPYPGWMSIDLRPAFPLSFASFPHLLGGLAYPMLIVASLWLMIRHADWKRFLGLALFIPAVLFATELVTVWIQDPFVLYRSYLWAIGIPFLAAFVWVGTRPRIVKGAMVVVAVLLAGVAIERVHSLRSDESVWADAAQKVAPSAPPNAVGRWRPLVNYGNELIQKEQFQQAAAQYAAAARTGEITGISDYHLALALLKLRQYPAALEAFRQAEQKQIHVSRFPAEFHLHKGQVLFFSGQHAQAIQSIGQSLAAKPDINGQQMALEIRAKAFIRLGRYQEAIDDYKTMVAVVPDDPNAYIGLAMALKAAGQFESALAVLDKRLQEKDNPDLRAGRVIVLIDKKQFVEARTELLAALSRYPAHPNLKQLAQRMGLQ